MAVARTQHDPVFAERHRVGIAIYGLVVNREERHRQTIIVILGGLIYTKHCSFTGRNAASIGNTQGYMALDRVGDTSLLLGPDDVPPVREYNDLGRSPFLLTCDHYGRLIPKALGALGLPES